ncbi:MAG: chemotaxis protein CheW [Gammaproteobacteria bacterium]|nr:chemotaxis protein CheW [Gammaproteobacteria bacterium]
MNQTNHIVQGMEAKQLDNEKDKENKVRCLTLSFLSYKMLIPNVSVAEVARPIKVNPQLGAPDWFGGMINWREQNVPVVILEKVMNTSASKPRSFRRILIVNAPNNKYCSPFIALGCQSIPSVTVIEKEHIAMSNIDSKVAVYVKLEGELYMIPRIEILEKIVSNVMKNLEIRNT